MTTPTPEARKNALLIQSRLLLLAEAAEWRDRDPKKEGRGRDRAQHIRIAECLEAAADAMNAAAHC